jgi:predicted transposase YbfD/YdcC
MAERPLALLDHFAPLSDPRVERGREHPLLSVVGVALCAILGGADDWVAVERFGNAKRDWFSRFLDLPGGIPSHDTFGRVFARLDPAQFEACFRDWVAAVTTRLPGQVAIDGKSLRGSRDGASGARALHLVSAWASEARLTLGLVALDDKSNEITAIPKLLQMLDLEGALVSIDAMGCQKEIAAQVREQKADYLLAVKGNQERLFQDVEAMFLDFADDERGYQYTSAQSSDGGHGREEWRGAYVFERLEGIRDRELWRDLAVVVVVLRERRVGGEISNEAHYYVSSRKADAELFLNAAREHWGIENGCHWVLDVCFAEDACRSRNGHAAQNLACLRRMALSMLKAADGPKCGTRNRRLTAGWDMTFLEQILSQAGNFSWRP